MMKLFDAHNHLHDAGLTPYHAEIFSELEAIDLAQAMVNGTSEEDWEAVAVLARAHETVAPSYGLHPWYVGQRSPRWQEDLRARLEADPAAAIGEIGLDRWVAGHDDAAQAEVFEAQLALAAESERPVTIHCIEAWGALAETLRRHPLPRGFLIHAYGGSAEMLAEFARLGGYFSYNAYFLHERKGKQRAIFRDLPADRLLVETDAPSLPPPEALNPHVLRDGSGAVLNHPANLAMTYEALAGLRDVSANTLSEQVEENFARLFGH